MTKTPLTDKIVTAIFDSVDEAQEGKYTCEVLIPLLQKGIPMVVAAALIVKLEEWIDGDLDDGCSKGYLSIEWQQRRKEFIGRVDGIITILTMLAEHEQRVIASANPNKDGIGGTNGS